MIVTMGSGTGPVSETLEYLQSRGEKFGLLTVRLFRPFDTGALLAALPKTTAAIAVLDRTKEPGAVADPLYLDVVAALNESPSRPAIRVIGGRYGLSSKEFTPGIAKSIFKELKKATAKNHFTIGIVDH